jgi:hypothetical protein
MYFCCTCVVTPLLRYLFFNYYLYKIFVANASRRGAEHIPSATFSIFDTDELLSPPSGKPGDLSLPLSPPPDGKPEALPLPGSPPPVGKVRYFSIFDTDGPLSPLERTEEWPGSLTSQTLVTTEKGRCFPSLGGLEPLLPPGREGEDFSVHEANTGLPLHFSSNSEDSSCMDISLGKVRHKQIIIF